LDAVAQRAKVVCWHVIVGTPPRSWSSHDFSLLLVLFPVWSGSARGRTSRWRSCGWPMHRRHGGATPLMASRWVRVWNTAAGLGGGVVPGGHRWRHRTPPRWRHRSPPATCRAGASRDRRAPRAQPAGPNGSLPTQLLPASEWCCCHTPRSSPLTFPIQSPHRRAAGMNQDGEHRVPRVQPADRRYRALHARPMVHLLPYPRPRRQGRAALRSHIGSGSVPGARGKQSKPRQITG
jgi:hypothetical protein